MTICILSFWYKTQSVCISWGQCTSLDFNVSNKASFCIYVDDLSYAWSFSNAGCYINNVCIHHLIYADDICMFAPTHSNLKTT